MKKSKVYNFLIWIVGFILAELWRRLLKDIHIHEFFKWLIGVAIFLWYGTKVRECAISIIYIKLGGNALYDKLDSGYFICGYYF
ncbi:hypothetical protein [Clostridium botulinum]|uniref:hypothetical protein n=1 Tax=Clostridium botulinum TaxID=1491 RepID=UPI00178CAAB8|nr:hypothetical protein [Clostridium botulinum]MBY6798774.1 hypothetical protein [Clostridium botulinum]